MPAAAFADLRLHVQELAVSRGGRQVLEGVSFAVGAGEALIVTGRNGVGKSTLLRAIAGLLPRAGGEVTMEGGAPDADLAQQAHYLAHADGMK
ncbi:MAG: ATP-binding cassette domain-containing protein, partial [Methylocystis sp.]|nr:ATP-binding cassette domain-containing protein [Methylocystis sp.]